MSVVYLLRLSSGSVLQVGVWCEDLEELGPRSGAPWLWLRIPTEL